MHCTANPYTSVRHIRTSSARVAGVSTVPLRTALEHALPERPFAIELWDGSSLPGTSEGATFRLRSPRALAHMLRAPGQLGLGRAYVAGDLEVDDIDAVLALLDDYEPAPL